MDQKKSQIIKLNVGGVLHITFSSTLLNESNTIFDHLFDERFSSVKLEDGSFFIDRDGKLFGYILNFLRSGNLPSLSIEKLELLRGEANYYQIKRLEEAIIEKMSFRYKTLY